MFFFSSFVLTQTSYAEFSSGGTKAEVSFVDSGKLKEDKTDEKKKNQSSISKLLPKTGESNKHVEILGIVLLGICSIFYFRREQFKS